ncbi:MAG: cob(I)yrinic acid a,c-diamide adenosyltransferase [Oligoflexia bacterium]|nr:cob(I)yrinic acid a,c-diamide adenosyltransferase [Oligoflexia bacterium]
MVKINKIYTRSGDGGKTHLVGGTMVDKDSVRVQAYGEVDELNSWIGMVRTLAEARGLKPIGDRLAQIQNELFDAGAELASPAGGPHPAVPKITPAHWTRVENWIDEWNEGLPELTSFVLPGGTEMNATLHIARTVCRRAERSIWALLRSEPVNPELPKYFNRLSDLLFALARRESQLSGKPEYLWTAGKS